MSREIPVTVARLDPESAGWLRALADTGPQRDAALARLRELLVRVARGEVARRGPRLQMTTHKHELAVFRMTDRPIQDTFGLCREQATDATPALQTLSSWRQVDDWQRLPLRLPGFINATKWQ